MLLAQHRDSNTSTDSTQFSTSLTTVVRRYLATAIRDLMQHGATTVMHSSSIVPFIACFPKTIATNSEQIHGWELILEYYHSKNGEKFNSTPARKLSQSFNLDIGGASPITNKHNMLCTIASIITLHAPYKRSFDSQFKAFICAALK